MKIRITKHVPVDREHGVEVGKEFEVVEPNPYRTAWAIMGVDGTIVGIRQEEAELVWEEDDANLC